MQDQAISILPEHIGLGSFAFRYAIGFKAFKSPRPMDAFSFMEKAHQMGYRRIQLCENLNYVMYSKNDLQRLRAMSKDLGMTVEVGLRKLDEENLSRHIEIALQVGAVFIRAVLHDHDNLSRQEQENVVTAAIKLLKQWAPRLADYGFTLGLENHFDVTTRDLVRIAAELASSSVGLVFDTTNSLGFLETPECTLKNMVDFVSSVHLKDYKIQKGETGYEIIGTALGEGALDIPAVFSLLGDKASRISIILESAARRNFQDTPEHVLEWEEDIIRKNTRKIEIIDKETRL